MNLINMLFNFICGTPLLVCLFGVGIFLTLRLKFIQIRYIYQMLICIKKSFKKTKGVSSFGAFCAAVGGQVGAANLAGVAFAIMAGGPGAVFWMWITAILGMATNFTEVVLGLLYRDKGIDGTPVGGPPYYIQKGLKCNWLAFLYSGIVIIGMGIFYAMMQSNVISTAFHHVFPKIPIFVIAIILVLLTATVVMGGFKRIANVATVLVPIMSILYMLLSLVIISMHISQIPDIFLLIIKSAFSSTAVGTGVAGFTIRETLRIGAARGLFSNDAGNGKASALHAGANIKHPVSQGILGMLSVFFDTIIMCTATATIILVTNAQNSGLNGLPLTTEASKIILGDFASIFMLILMSLLGFTTLIADIAVGSSSLSWLIPRKKNIITSFRIVCCFLVGLGCFIPLNILFNFIDFMSALMVFTNIIPLIILSPKVLYVLKDYENQRKNGIDEPIWDFNQNIDNLDYISDNTYQKNIKT